MPQFHECIFLVGFKKRRAFEFQQFPVQGPKLNPILETDVPDKHTLSGHLWYKIEIAANSAVGAKSL